jgi:membrane associated rhomboid family serine protease
MADTPPPHRLGRAPTSASPPGRATRLVAVPVIIALNIVVFLGWKAAASVPLLRAFMASNFIVSASHLRAGLVWTLITSEFSHIELWHIFLNMFVLWSFGRLLERLWGSRVFVGFYLTAAIVASLSHCAVSALLLGEVARGAVGASGAVSGVLVAYALAFPRHRIYLFGVLPIPALAGAVGLVALDLWGLYARAHGGGLPIGHGAHLGGAAAGAAMYFLYLRSHFAERLAVLRSPGLSASEVREVERLWKKSKEHGADGLDANEREFLRRLSDRFSRGK